MKNVCLKHTAILIALAMTLVLLPVFAVTASADIWDGSAVAAAFDGGTGTKEDPFRISTAAQLAYLGKEDVVKDSADKYYKLTANISLADKPWAPITDFFGTFDGGNFTVSGLNSVNENIDTNTYGGLFGQIKNATVMNLTVTGSKVQAKYAGGIVGLATSSAIINCRSAIDWIDGLAIGGIVGRSQSASSVILYCTSESTVKQTMTGNTKGLDHFIGGIVGAAGGTVVSYCANKGNIICDHADGKQGDDYYLVGGIVGVLGASSVASDIKYCYNTGNITGYQSLTSATEKSFAGGITARSGHVADSQITGCYSTGNIVWKTERNGSVDAAGYYGGIIGIIAKTSSQTNCYTTMTEIVGNNAAAADISGLKMLTLSQMQGKDALNNMNLGTSLTAVLDEAVGAGIVNANYKSDTLKAFEDYTGGKTLSEYIKGCVLAEFDLPAGAELWVTADGKTPELGNLDAIRLSSEIPAQAGALVNAELAKLYEIYKADPKNTTAATQSEEDPGDETTTGKRVTVIVNNGTTAGPNQQGGTTKAPDGNGGGTEKRGCGTFAATAAVIAVICGGTAIVAVKKKF